MVEIQRILTQEKPTANGIINSILQEICFWPFHIEVSVILRESLFINSTLGNSKSWYGLTENEIVELAKEDEKGSES